MDIAKIRRKLKESPEEERKLEAAEVPSATIRDSQDSSSASISSNANKISSVSPVEATDLEEVSLAEGDGDSDKAEEIVELLVFSLSNEEYAFRVSELEEIIRPQQITYIPKTPEYLLGVTSLRGKIMPVVDLKGMLLLAGSGESKKQKIVILKGNRGPMGVRVDRILGVVRLPISGLTECPSHLNESQLRFIEKVAIFNGRFISIINTEEISEMASNESI